MTGMERVDVEPAFVLHARAYRESSEILEILTRNHGRIGMVARGMRRSRINKRAILQPFQLVRVSWSGRDGGLMTLRSAESGGPASSLQGTALMSAFYVNELLMRFLHKSDPHPQLFDDYAGLLMQLESGSAPEVVLRHFELGLLAQTGYGLNLDHDAATGDPLDPSGLYRYVVERGPMAADAGQEPGQLLTGAVLLAIGRGDFTDERARAGARRLIREVLDHHLGGRPLHTRRVFAAMQS